MNWSVFLAAGGSASIEFLETAAIAYAIARSGYLREALWGSLAGLTAVAGIAGVFGTGLQAIPLHWLQIGIGTVLLWFGWGWVKKSVLRQVQGKRAGWIADDPLTVDEHRCQKTVKNGDCLKMGQDPIETPENPVT
jgi:Ca2+/H+ antiporter, TMEM165/GDT1 family